MARLPASSTAETSLESDRYKDTPHPREAKHFFGHAGALQNLSQAYRMGYLPQALILAGPPGTGKATLAWRLARFVLANPDPGQARGEDLANFFVPPSHPVFHQVAAMAHPDLILLRREWSEKDKKLLTEIRIEDVRRAIHLFQQAAGQGGYRVCILDCAEELNLNSANALLKLIEEPPPRSLFLIIANRPGRMLPTLRSRCQKILLNPLSRENIRDIVMSLGPPWANADESQLAAAITRAQGSVHPVLRLLDEDGIALDTQLGRLLNNLPHVDWGEVHDLADRISARAHGEAYETWLTTIADWLDARVRLAAGSGAANVNQLAPFALVWEKLSEAAREAEILNLDKRPLVLSLFADLAAATEASSL